MNILSEALAIPTKMANNHHGVATPGWETLV